MTAFDTARLAAKCRGSSVNVSLTLPDGREQTWRRPARTDEWSDVAERIYRVLTRACRHTGGNREDADELRKLCQRCASLVLPSDAQWELAGLSGCALRLCVDQALMRLPWELLVVDGDFLCLRSDVARASAVTGNAPIFEAPDARLPVRTTLVVNPEFNLPAAAREGDALRRLFSNREHFGRPRILANRVTRDALLEVLSKTDWLHFAGHAVGAGDGRHWQLANGTFGPKDVRRTKVGTWPRFVFAHACASAESGDPAAINRNRLGSAGHSDTDDTLAEALLLAGVRHFVGTRAPVLDEDCLQFIECFYAGILKAQPVGSALRAARRWIVEQFGIKRLVWANYMLYGDPTARLVQAPCDEWDQCFYESSREPHADDVRLSYPVECTDCGRSVRTRHGIGEILQREATTSILCRRCARMWQ